MALRELEFEILGSELQIVEITLGPGETVIAEAGSMNYMEDGIRFEARLGDGSDSEGGLFSKLADAGKRMFAGESMFLTHFTNHANERRTVAFAAPFAGQILAIDLSQHSEGLLCQRESCLCASRGTRLGIAFQKKLGAGLFGGDGFVLEKLEGEGIAFLHAGGHVVQRELNGEMLPVDTGSMVAFTDGIKFDIERTGGLKSMMFGGEGMFPTTLSGTGIVLL
ncbi:MAG: AIM24 family protein [Planctomycetaceae bacterium]